MTTLLFSHDACLDHNTGEGHPERSDRLRAVNNALGAAQFSALDRREAPEVSSHTLIMKIPYFFFDYVLERVSFVL